MHEPPDDERLSEDLLTALHLSLGARLREFRLGKELSEREVADYAGVTQATWSRVERGTTSPRIAWLLQAQAMFGVDSIETLFGVFPSRRLPDSGDSQVTGETE